MTPASTKKTANEYLMMSLNRGTIETVGRIGVRVISFRAEQIASSHMFLMCN